MLSSNEVDGRFWVLICDGCGFGGDKKDGGTMSLVSHSMSFCAFCK